MAYAGSTKTNLLETKLRPRKTVCQNKQKENVDKISTNSNLNTNSHSNSKIVTKADRRRRGFSLEARQIKRAHRHLLTSEVDCQNNRTIQELKKSFSTSKIAVAVAVSEQQYDKNDSSLSYCTTSARNVRGTKKKQQSKIVGLENKKEEKSQVNKKQKRTQNKRNSRHKAKNRDDNISERWHSIERKIEQLEELLHICDICYDTDIDSTMDNETESDLQSTTSSYDSIPISLVPASLKRRGHQHHPRFAGSRVPANVQQIVNAISLGKDESEENVENVEEIKENVIEETTIAKGGNKKRHGKSSKHKDKSSKEIKSKNLWPETEVDNEWEKSIDEGIELDDEGVSTDWAKLRCTSESVEVVAERETRRNKQRCADYPGLAFACSIFSSDTMMKFNIIRNELHNIMKTQLKRAESEVAALNRRIQLLEEDLERSEERLGSATAKLSEASQAADESERIRKALENRTNMEDDRVGILETQLAQAKLIAEEADKKYEEVARKLVLMEQDLERSEEKAELSESKIVELEEELRVVGNNLKSLEVSEEKANQREEEYKNQIKTLNTRLKEAEARAEFAERSVQKLQKEVDRLEDDLMNERAKNKMLQEEMEATLHDIQNM